MDKGKDLETSEFFRQAAQSSLRKAHKAAERGSREVQETHIRRASEATRQFILAGDPDAEIFKTEDEKPNFSTKIMSSTDFTDSLKQAATDLGEGERIKLSPPGTTYEYKGRILKVDEGHQLAEISEFPRRKVLKLWERLDQILEGK